MSNYKTIKFTDGDFSLDISISPNEETLWFSLNDLCTLFNKDKSVISRHIKNVFRNELLESDRTVAKNARVQLENGRKVERIITLYNLDVVLAISNKIGSKRGKKLKEFLSEYLNSIEDQLYENNQIIIFDNGNVHLDVKVSPKEDTVWLLENQIAELFDTSRQNVNLHIKNIFEDKELSPNSVCKDFLHTAQDGKSYLVKFYNLDLILSVGYRVKSTRAIEFRKWATEVLKNVMIQGYSIQERRCLECQSSIQELKIKVLQLEQKQHNSITYYPGDELRGFIEIKRFLQTATKEILIVDDYFGHEFDDVLSKITAEKTIITDPKNQKIETSDNYKVIKTKLIHDRYIIVDDTCYHFGASLKDLGSSLSSGHLFTDQKVIALLKSYKSELK